MSLYELTTFSYFYPLPSRDWEQRCQQKDKPDFPDNYPGFFKELCRKAWHDDPGKRPEAHEIKAELEEIQQKISI